MTIIKNTLLSFEIGQRTIKTYIHFTLVENKTEMSSILLCKFVHKIYKIGC